MIILDTFVTRTAEKGSDANIVHCKRDNYGYPKNTSFVEKWLYWIHVLQEVKKGDDANIVHCKRDNYGYAKNVVIH